MNWQRHVQQLGFGDGEENLANPLQNLRGPRQYARAMLTIAVCWAALVMPTMAADMLIRQALVVGVMTVSWMASVLLRRGPSRFAAFIVGVLDISVVSATIWATRSATGPFYLTYLLVLVAIAFTNNRAVSGWFSVLIAAIYAVLVHSEVGLHGLMQQEYLIRLGVLVGMGFFFGLMSTESARVQEWSKGVEGRMYSVASHAKSLARDKYRLRVLSEIGRLGLVGTPATGSNVLFEISRRVQKGVGVDRVSMVVFADGDTGYVAASSDDDKVEVRPLDVTHYPELQETLAHGEITEVHPGRPKELWDRICEFLPEAYEFKSFLVVPIKTDDRVFGAFYLRDVQPDRGFDEEEQAFCWAAALMTASFIRSRDLVEQLRQQSRIDGLTGLLNFQAFAEQLDQHLHTPQARSRAPYTLVVMDMDNLKPINDIHGHVAGNRAITEMGEQFRHALPDALAMSRYGGDEFVALVRAGRDDVIGRLNAMLNRMSTLEWDQPFALRASIGIAEYPRHAETSEALLESADQAMYMAKGAGGHRIRVASSETTPEEICDAVVHVQARRLSPELRQVFDQRLKALGRRAILGLQSQAVRESADALADAVEEIDPFSRRHARQVARIARALAESMRVSRDEVRRIEMAARLHDVGKIELPPHLVTKPEPLEPEERAVIQQCPALGAALLDRITGLDQVADLVRAYQERWDGSGYPQGLRGDDIPLGAQIVGIADVYSALTQARPHRAAADVATAQRLIEQEVGRLWSPAVARMFIQLLAERGATFHQTEASESEMSGSDERNDRRRTA